MCQGFIRLQLHGYDLYSFECVDQDIVILYDVTNLVYSFWSVLFLDQSIT